MPVTLSRPSSRMRLPFGQRIDVAAATSSGLYAAWQCNEGGGNTLYDALGRYHARPDGSHILDWRLTQVGHGCIPDGGVAGDGPASTLPNANFQYGPNVTYAALVSPTNVGPQAQVICGAENTGGPNCQLRQDAGLSTAQFLWNGTVLTSNASMVNGGVYAWTATYDGITQKIFLNGVLDIQSALSTTINTTAPFGVGGGENNATIWRPWQGTLLYLYVWQRALSDAEVHQVYIDPASVLAPFVLRRWDATPANTTPTATESAALGDAPPLAMGLGGQYALERPVSDTSAGLWTPSTGGSLFGTLNETVADATTFDLSSTSPASDTFEVALGTAPVAIDLTSMPGVLNYQYRGTVQGGRRVDLTVVLLCNGTPVQTWTLPAIGNTFIIAPLQLDPASLAAITPGGALSLRTTATQV